MREVSVLFRPSSLIVNKTKVNVTQRPFFLFFFVSTPLQLKPNTLMINPCKVLEPGDLIQGNKSIKSFIHIIPAFKKGRTTFKCLCEAFHTHTRKMVPSCKILSPQRFLCRGNNRPQEPVPSPPELSLNYCRVHERWTEYDSATASDRMRSQ